MCLQCDLMSHESTEARAKKPSPTTGKKKFKQKIVNYYLVWCITLLYLTLVRYGRFFSFTLFFGLSTLTSSIFLFGYCNCAWHHIYLYIHSLFNALLLNHKQNSLTHYYYSFVFAWAHIWLFPGLDRSECVCVCVCSKFPFHFPFFFSSFFAFNTSCIQFHLEERSRKTKLTQIEIKKIKTAQC